MSYPYEFALFAERNRNRAYDEVVRALEKAAEREGITQSQIAAAMGRKPPQVSAWLSGPSNWTLDTISDLLRAVGATMEYSVLFDSDRVASNVFHPALAETKNDPTPLVSLAPPPAFPTNSTNGYFVQFRSDHSTAVAGASTRDLLELTNVRS